MHRNRRSLILLACLFLLIGCRNSGDRAREVCTDCKPRIIPLPQEYTIWKDRVILDENTSIWSDGCEHEAMLLQKYLSESFELKPAISDESKPNQIRLILDESGEDIPHSAYRIQASDDLIIVKATSHEGIFYGLQSLLQSMEKEGDKLGIQSLEIFDYPKFRHRGLLLDCCRHFFSVKTVKQYIDMLAFYKMNVLHWHLTEDQGWRVQIDKYPLLTEVGAWRMDTAGNKYGGYYTKKEIREVVAYAAERYITVIPEIELPGHAQAALAAYPEFSCIGHDVQVVNDWGVFKEIYCAGNEGTFEFLEGVLDEVLELFPSEYIHIGGDEVPKYRWEHCEKCQSRMKELGLKSEEDLQGYFVRRIEGFLNSRGRKLIGWDEIMEGDVSGSAAIQCWRGVEYGLEAAKAEREVIMSPTSHCYLDYDLKSIDVEKIYQFDPIPEGLDASNHQFIIGGEGNMWTEHVPDTNALDQKVFPRLIALSEVLWTYPEKRDFTPFFQRLRQHYPLLSQRHIDYGLEGNPVKVVAEESGGVAFLRLQPGVPDIDLSYSVDSGNGNSEEFKPCPEQRVELNFTGTLKVKANRGGDAYGDVFEQKVAMHHAILKKPQLTHPYSKWYTAGGDLGLTDGKLASLDFRDGNWQGYAGEDFEAVIDLGNPHELSFVSCNFYQYNNAWIFAPESVEVYYSLDGKDWKLWGVEKSKVPTEMRGKFITSFGVFTDKPVQAQYVKYKANNIGEVPPWHEAAGSEAWLFLDEIIVN